MLRPLLCALGFLTRIPVPHAFTKQELARSAGCFSWVGALIAALLWAVARLFAPFDARIAALLVVIAWTACTGGLHLDGLADSIDGLSGGRGQRERTLEIMRDSRIGSHGALALLLLVALKWAALERLLLRDAWLWLGAPVCARYAATVLVARFPYARGQGLGSGFAGQVGGRELLVGALPVLLLALLGLSALVAAAVGMAAALLVALRFQRLLGGLTGDVYGAAVEVCEVTCLTALALR